MVENPAAPIWTPDREWRVVEEVRVGGLEGDGPEVFGRITSFEVDASGQLWVLDGQAQELRVFEASGSHVRTVGRRGGGPGEFAQAVRVEQGPDGHVWVMDPQNSRISVFDSAGVFLEEHQTLGGFIMLPWPGGFDANGSYYAPVPRPDPEAGFRVALVRYDTALVALDTL